MTRRVFVLSMLTAIVFSLHRAAIFLAKFFFRSDSGNYEGVDESNVKLEITCNKFPPLRKVSKMLNGLGDDM